MPMKKSFFPSLLLLFLAGCSLFPEPVPIIDNTPHPPVVKIEIPLDTPIEIESIGEEKRSGEDENGKPYLLYFKKALLPTYNISILYMTPRTYEYDREHAQRIQSGHINPQGRPTMPFPERTDFKEFEPCLFYPITVYQLKGSLDEAIQYFEEQEGIKYTRLGIEEFVSGERYWDKKRGTSGLRGKNFVKYVPQEKISVYQWKGSTSGIWERTIIYNSSTPERVYKLDTQGSDCFGYPAHAIIDFIN